MFLLLRAQKVVKPKLNQSEGVASALQPGGMNVPKIFKC